MNTTQYQITPPQGSTGKCLRVICMPLLIAAVGILMPTAPAQDIRISKDFESAITGDYTIKGNVVTFTSFDPLNIREQTFRISGVKGRTIKFIIQNVRDTSRQDPLRNSWHRMSVSYDNLETFVYADNGKYDPASKEFSFTFTFARDDAIVTSFPKYGNQRLTDWWNALADKTFIKCEVLLTTDGLLKKGPNGHAIPQPLRLFTITDPDYPDASKFVAWIIAREDGFEVGSTLGLLAGIGFLLSDDKLAAEIRKNVIFKVIPIVSVDGVSSGASSGVLDGWDGIGKRTIYLTNTWGTDIQFGERKAIEQTIASWIKKGNRFDLGLRWHHGPIDNGVYYEYNSSDLASCIKTRVAQTGATSLDKTNYKATPTRWSSWVRNTFNKTNIPFVLYESGVRFSKGGVSQTYEQLQTVGVGVIKGVIDYINSRPSAPCPADKPEPVGKR